MLSYCLNSLQDSITAKFAPIIMSVHTLLSCKCLTYIGRVSAAGFNGLLGFTGGGL
jgi:hypothetical protein